MKKINADEEAERKGISPKSAISLVTLQQFNAATAMRWAIQAGSKHTERTQKYQSTNKHDQVPETQRLFSSDV